MFKIPDTVEFIESIRRPTGGFAAEPGGGEVLDATFAPVTRTNSTVQPLPQHYAWIIFRFAFSASMIPDAVHLYLQSTGRDRWAGYVSHALIEEGLTGYFVITRNDPLAISRLNATPQLQYFQMLYHYALVYSLQDYELIVKSLDERANKGGLRDAHKLLALMGPFLKKQR